MDNKANERIDAFRKLMKAHSIDAAIIPQTDPHMSEYLAERYQTRRWLSGFTGSAGSLVVTQDQAYVWADSRYWLQADNQLKGTCISVMKEGQPSTPTISEWLVKTLSPGSKVGIDGMLFSKSSADDLKKSLEEKNITLVTDFDVIPQLWTDRPQLPDGEVFLHDEKYAGESASAKIQRVLADARERGADSIFIADLAEIAWILNIRSCDVKCNPVAISYLYIDNSGGGVLFINPAKVSPELSKALKDTSRIEVVAYDAVQPYLEGLPESSRVLTSPTKTPATIVEALGERAVLGESAIGGYKGCKNKVQVEGVKRAMIRDGVALVKSFMEIEKALSEEKPITEMDIAEILTRHRKAQPLYFDDSFETIAGFGPHGAIVHYSARPDTNATLTPDNLLLIDSGASYLDGTTDITRTVYLGECPPKAMAHDFTLVLKGHIDLAMAVFPEGTSGMQLDVLARMPLWKDGKTYLHGTGHGVGHFLNVHEGPQRITYNANMVPLKPGMITSDEPGVYLSDRYGIRCENLLLTKEAFTTEFGRFLKFEVLTLFPFDLKLVEWELLSGEEREWLRHYQTYVYQQLAPHLNDEERRWLDVKTNWTNESLYGFTGEVVF